MEKISFVGVGNMGGPLCERLLKKYKVDIFDLNPANSKKMKELGFSFCGPVTVYSFMQASGIVNDHLVSCPHYLKCQKD